MSAADHYAQAEDFLSAANLTANRNPDIAAIAHALLAIGGFIVQFSVPGVTVLSEEAQTAQRVVEGE